MKNEKIVKLLQAFTPWDAQEAADVESALRAVRAFDDIASRSNPIVHLCASPYHEPGHEEGAAGLSPDL